MTRKLRLGLLVLAVCLTTNAYASEDMMAERGTDTQPIGVLRQVGKYHFMHFSYAVTELADGTIFSYGANPDHLQDDRESLERRRRSAGMDLRDSHALAWQPGLNGWKSVDVPPECNNNRLLHTLTPLPDNRVLIAGGLCDGPRMGDDTSFYPPHTKLSIWNGNTQKWESAPSLQVARLYHTASLLSDGSVMLVGGEPDPSLYTEKQPVLAAVEHFRDGAVSQLANLHVARARHAATPLDKGALLITGGVGTDGKALDSVELWEPDSQSWRELPPLNAARYNHAAVRLSDGSVMVAGGIGSTGQPLASVEIWSPGTRQWSRGSELLYPLQGHLAVLLASGDVLVMGGRETFTVPAQRWDNKTQHWLPAGEMVNKGNMLAAPYADSHHLMTLVPHPDGGAHAFTRSAILHWLPALANSQVPYGKRDHFAVTLLKDGRVMLSGGFSMEFGQDGVEIYDPRSGRFSLTGRMHQRRFKHASLLLDDGRVLVAGGWVWAEGMPKTPIANYPEVWNPQSGKWSLLKDIHFNSGEWVHMARLEDGRVLFFASDEVMPAVDAPVGQADYRAWLWNPASGKVEQKVVNASPRSGAAVAILADGRLLRVGGFVRTFVPAQNCPPRRPVDVTEEEEGCVAEPAHWEDVLDNSAEIWDSGSGTLRVITPPPEWSVRDGRTQVLQNGDVLFVEYSPEYGINHRSATWLWEVRTERWQPFAAWPAEWSWQLLELPDGMLVTARHYLPKGAKEWQAVPALIQMDPQLVQNGAGDVLSISTAPPYAAVLDMTTPASWQVYQHADIPPAWMTVPALAALRDGRVMAVARTERNPEATFSAHIWDPRTDTWSSAGRLGSHTDKTTMLQLPSGAVLHAGQDNYNRFICELWDAASNRWQACGEYKMDSFADHQLALGLLEDGRAVVVANMQEAFVFEQSTLQWTKQRIEWDMSGMDRGAPLRNSVPLARIPDSGSLSKIDITPVAAQYWQTTMRDSGHSIVFRDSSLKFVPGRGLPPALLWDPKGKQWAYVLLPDEMGRNATLLPDGCALSWMPLTIFNPQTGKVTLPAEPGMGIEPWRGNMVVLADGTVVIAGLPNGNNTGFFHRKASCNGFEASPADTDQIPFMSYKKERPIASNSGGHAASLSGGWWESAEWMLLEYRWIILVLAGFVVLYIFFRVGVGSLFYRIRQALTNKRLK